MNEMNDFDAVEKQIKEEEAEKNKSRHKVSGRSVFNLQKIIQEKAKEEESGDSKEPMAGDK